MSLSSVQDRSLKLKIMRFFLFISQTILSTISRTTFQAQDMLSSCLNFKEFQSMNANVMLIGKVFSEKWISEKTNLVKINVLD